MGKVINKKGIEESKVVDLITTVNGLVFTVQQLADLMMGKFDEVNRKFDEVNGRFNEVNSRFNEVDGKFDEMKKYIDGRFNQQSRELKEYVDSSIILLYNHIDKRFEVVDQRFNRIDNRLDKMDRRFVLIEKNMSYKYEVQAISHRVDKLENTGE